MPDQYTISSLTPISVSEPLGMNDLVEVARVDEQGETGYSSRKATLGQLGDELLNDIQYTSALDTTNKKIIGAINEVRGTFVTGTLTAGSTSLTLSDASITTSSTIDIYTDVFGIQPVNASVSTGTITLTFLAQSADISVKVRVS